MSLNLLVGIVALRAHTESHLLLSAGFESSYGQYLTMYVSQPLNGIVR